MFSSKNRVGIVGLGYVGLPLAVEFSKSFAVVGFDTNSKRIQELRHGEDKTREVSASQLQQCENLHFSSEVADLEFCDIFIVTVPTPVDSSNKPDLSALMEATKTVAKILRPGAIVIYESTVFPGCTEEVCVPIIEEFSGLRFNEGFFCGYSPERINPGDKDRTLTNIVKVTSGSTDAIATLVDNLYNSIIDAGTWKAPSIKVAEAAKVIENSQRDLNIAFVNELSIIFDRLGIDTLDVLEAAGTKWNFLPFRPGMVGGHCIGVDPYYLTHKAELVGYNPQVILAGRRINQNMARYVARNVTRLMILNKIDVSKSTVGVLGITFKENCPDIRNTRVIDLIRELKTWGIRVIVSDPWANADEVREEYQIELTDINEFGSVDALIVSVGHKEYREYSLAELRALCRGDRPVLGDVKAIYDKKHASTLGFTVFRL